MKRLKIIGILLLFLIIIGGALVIYQTRDRHPDYLLDLTLPLTSGSSSDIMQVGLAQSRITPPIEDTWVDVDGNARFEPKTGDSFIDRNGNGVFDAFWLAGFHNRRPAQGVHDELWARAIVWDDNVVQIACVTLDAIGLFHDDVITLRDLVRRQAPEIDHVIVSSTHSHEVPDLMGLWGESEYKSGVNRDYLHLVQQQAAQAVVDAYRQRQPAIVSIAQIDSIGHDIIMDGRPPARFDSVVRMMRFTHAETKEHLGILLNFGCHPETMSSRNLQITADFVHYLLDGVEKGIIYDGEVKRAGLGGMALFAQGAIGGLMTTLDAETNDPWLNKTFAENDCSFDKARAQGFRLAEMVIDAVDQADWQFLVKPALRVRAKTFRFKAQNQIFKLGAILGVFDRGIPQLKYIRSEIDLFSIGSAWFLTLPGEVNPEIVNGGVETPAGRDYEIDPVEAPPLRQLMRGDIQFVLGLANDEVGYIMPKTHWDAKPPFTYGEKEAMYGEINSLGPDAGPVLYEEVKKLIADL